LVDQVVPVPVVEIVFILLGIDEGDVRSVRLLA
jgi:hypothetical protein